MARPDDQRHDVTRWLKDWSAGRRNEPDQLFDAVHGELRRLARAYMSRERPDHTLQPTALVHEAFIKLVNQKDVTWQNRAHFYGISAQCMRRILVDSVRRKRASKRPNSKDAVPLDDAVVAWHGAQEDVVAVDEALEKLAALDARQASIVELKYFGGLTAEEIAEVLGISRATVTRELLTARMWLTQALKTGT